MNISGTYQFNAPAQVVWERLTDPQAIAGCIPGCNGFDSTGPDQYQTVLNVNVGPINGSYTARFAFQDRQPLQSFKLAIQVSGPAGSARGEPIVTLVEQSGQTTVQVEGDAQIGGVAALMGAGMIGNVAQGLVDRFFECLGESTLR